MFAVPSFRSIRMAISLVPDESSHSWVHVKPMPCILPFGRLLVPAGCHFSFQLMAAMPFSTHSLRLSRTCEAHLRLALRRATPCRGLRRRRS